MKRLFKTKKRVALLVSIAALAVAAGAYAYFTSTGSGSGTGSTATPAALTISEVGAGYDSLIPSESYSQDQCFGCAGISDFGNEVNLANAPAGTYVQLTSVTVAFRNWGTAFSDVPITLSIGGYSDTVTPSFGSATTVGSNPSTQNVTFNFSGQNAFVTSPLTYDISFSGSGDGASLNVALSDSNYDVSVGGDTVNNTVWLETEAVAPTGSPTDDFPAGTVFPTPGTFGSVTTDGGPQSGVNPGAYGTESDNANIPAVEINDVGGVAPDLSPGVTEPIDYAITNPGTTSVTVSSVLATISSVTGGAGACSAQWNNGDPSAWYVVGGTSPAAATVVPPGTTIFSPSGLTLLMTSPAGVNQSACEGASVSLTFSST